MKEALNKAIEGGWKNYRINYLASGEPFIDWQFATSDPFFWQALGKSLGWGYFNVCDQETYDREYSKCAKCNWHRFIDHLAEGKDPDSFFQALLTKEE